MNKSDLRLDYKPALALMSSMRSIQALPFFKTELGKIISGNSYFKARYNFSKVLRFICGQSLQAQELFGGAGMNILFGECFSI